MNESAFSDRTDHTRFFAAIKERFLKDGRIDERRCVRGTSLAVVHLPFFMKAVMRNENREAEDALVLLGALETHNGECEGICREGCVRA